MVRIICEAYEANNSCTLTIKGENYQELKNAINKIHDYISTNISPTCEKTCANYYLEGCLGGYRCASCKIHGNLEFYGNPHHDMDTTKCSEYTPIKNKENNYE